MMSSDPDSPNLRNTGELGWVRDEWFARRLGRRTELLQGKKKREKLIYREKGGGCGS